MRIYLMSIGNSMKPGFVKAVCILQFSFLFAISAAAQDTTAGENKWHFLAEPYLMFPNLKGTVGVGTLPDAELDADPGDIFSHFKIAAILYFEAANDKWAVSSDMVYLSLDQDATPGRLINNGSVDVKQLTWELAGLRKLLPWLEAGIGGRLNSFKTDIDLVTKNIGGGTTARSKSISQTWFDPIIMARVKNGMDKKFLYQFRGDIGGFGIGSEFAWQIQVYAGYRFSKLFQATAGYKVISVDYNKGSGEDRFLFDVDTFGPVLRLGFNF
jgi:hypothetical protein